MTRAAAVAIIAGVAADAVLGDPRRGHPVALFGTAATRLERAMWRDSTWAGAGYVAACVLPLTALGVALDRAGRWRAPVFAATLWAVVGGRSLAGEARAVLRLLEQDDLPAARQRLTHLVGRDTSELEEHEICRAVVESVAENASDAVVAPLVWGSVGGIGGLVAYRVINTLDAMVGHRSPRYRHFGWAAARLDDVANLAPARLTALLAGVCAPLVGGSPTAAWRSAARWAGAHPSPNAGWAEAAFAGALDVRLGGRNVYAGVPEDRPVLGDGRPVVRADIARANRLLAATTTVTTVLCALAASRRRGRR